MEEIIGADTIEEEKENVNKEEGSNWYQEKRILLNEIERLRKAILDLSERQSVLEDFIEVEYCDKFERFLKKRDHLISMGFGQNEFDKDGNKKKTVDGKRKSSELIELLKMTKEQTNGSSCSGSTDTISGGPPSGDPPNASLSDSTSSPSNSQSSSQQSQSLPVVQKPNKKRKKNKNSSTIEQQSIDSAMSMGEPKPNQFPPQRSSSSGPPAKISKDAYSDSKQFQEGSDVLSGHLDEDEDIKMEMGDAIGKRKRNEISSSAANSSSVSMSGGGEDEDDSTNTDNDTITKRICPVALCGKVMRKKFLMDHLLEIHQGFNIKCRERDCNKMFRKRHKLKYHMRNAHRTPMNEAATYVKDIVSSLCGPWLQKMCMSALIPTKEQIMERQQKVEVEAKKVVLQFESSQDQSDLAEMKDDTLNASQIQNQNAGGGGGGAGKNNAPKKKRIAKRHLRICPVQLCGKVVKLKGLRPHLTTHQDQGDFPIKCRDCDEEFWQRASLRVHMREAHRTPNHESSAYVRNAVLSHFEPWLDEMCMNALIPLKGQMVEYQKEMEAHRTAQLKRGRVQSGSSEGEDEDGTLDSQIQSCGSGGGDFAGGHFDEVDVEMGNKMREQKRKSGEISSAANSSSASMSTSALPQGQGHFQNESQNAGGDGTNEPNMKPNINVVCPVPLCEKAMKKKVLMEHLLTKHQKHLRFKCRDCNNKFSQRHKLRIHMRNKHGTPNNEAVQYVYDLVQSLCGPWLSQMCTSAVIVTNPSENQQEVEGQLAAQLESSQDQSDLMEMEDDTLKTSQIQSSVSGSNDTPIQMPNIPGSAGAETVPL